MSGDIVLATRFGTSSNPPAMVAAELARRFGTRITVVYVASELAALEASGGEAGVDPRAEREHILARIHDGLTGFVDRHFTGIEVATRIEEGGDVAEIVTRVAGEVQAHYLIVGTRGRGQLARLILGDTTQTILQRTPCPVVVVPLAESDEGR